MVYPVARLVVINLSVLGGAVAALLGALALLHLIERAVGRFVAHRLGWRAVLVTGWIGVPVHELSHLVTAVVFRHRIVGWSLFDPDPSTGTLGYVRHAYRRRSPWQLAGGFFIGVAPLAGGAAVLAAVLVWMVPPARLLALLGESGLFAAPVTDAGAAAELARRLGTLALGLAAAVWRSRSWWLVLQLYLCAAVAAHLAPSGRDLVGGLPGAALVAVLLVGAAVGCAWRGTTLAGALVLVPAAGLLVLLTALFQTLYAAAVAGVAAVFGRR
jgi:hypothetical protein